MKHRRYAAYKDSGVEWIGKIPKKWKIKKVKYLFQEISEKNFGNENILAATQQYGVIPKKMLDFRTVEATTTDLNTFKLVNKGDFVISLRSFEGGIEFSKYRGIISPAYTVIRPQQRLCDTYYKYLFKSEAFIQALNLHKTGIREGQNISYERFKDDFLPFPTIDEQIQIADYLDKKTAQIDKAVTLKERLIKRLKEQRQILINRAVTQGLDPDVPMKESGVEWIGKIPAHWEVRKFRFLFDFAKGLNITKENLQKEGIPCVNYGEIHSKYGFEVIPERDPLKCVDTSYLKTNPKSILKRGDFVFADTSEDVEAAGSFTYLNSDTPTFAGYHTIIARAKTPIFNRFMAYFFSSDTFKDQVRSSVRGVKVYSITNAILKDTRVCLPPKQEQIQIADYLDKKTTQIDKAITLQQNQIEKLKAYKASLIDAVVTGKVKIADE